MPVSSSSSLMLNDLTCLQAAGRTSREGVPTGNPSPVLPLVGRTRRQLVSEAAEDEAEDRAVVVPFVSPSTGMGTTAAASIPPASPDLSLPAPSWLLTRSRGSTDLGSAGRATARGLGLVGVGVRARRPGSLPRNLQEMRRPPVPLEERPRPGPPAVLEEDSWSIRGLGLGSYGRAHPRCVPLLEVAPYMPPAGRGRGRGLLLGGSHQPHQTGGSGAGLGPRSDQSGFQRFPEPERRLFEQREAILPMAEVEGQAQHHLYPRDSPDSSQASSDAGAEVDSESVASDPSDAGAVSVEDLHLLGLILDDALQLSDVRAVVSFVRRQLHLLLASASNDQASSTSEEREPGAAADL